MRFSKAVFAAAALAFCVVVPRAFAQDAGAADPQRKTAALELIEVTGAKKQIELMLEVMRESIGKGTREAGGNQAESERVQKEFADFSAKFQGYRDQMIDEFAALYAERFTTDELKDIANFYRSGSGAKFVAAMPELMQRGGVIGQKYGLMAMRELEAIKKGQSTEPAKQGGAQ